VIKDPCRSLVASRVLAALHRNPLEIFSGCRSLPGSGRCNSRDSCGSATMSNSSSSDSPQQQEPTRHGVAVRLRGLPFTATTADVQQFFSGFKVQEILLCTRDGEPRTRARALHDLLLQPNKHPDTETGGSAQHVMLCSHHQQQQQQQQQQKTPPPHPLPTSHCQQQQQHDLLPLSHVLMQQPECCVTPPPAGPAAHADTR
jgi:hypothetical protein